MKKTIFQGVGTALITPFKDGEIDYDTLGKLIERQIDAECAAIIIGGTTGESATLSADERYKLFAFAKSVASGRIKLIFGTGTNDTKATVKHTEKAEKIGCDGVLVITPYYNKGTRDGLKRHYEVIARSTSLPIILYNVPPRTGVDLPPSLVEELSEIPNIVAIKEATDSAERLLELSNIRGIDLYAGNDSALYSVLALGGCGVISVLSNVYPKECIYLCKQFFTGRWESAIQIQQTMLPVINSLFAETNPAPLKYLMAKKGLCSGEIRLPLCLPSLETQKNTDVASLRFEKEINSLLS